MSVHVPTNRDVVHSSCFGSTGCGLRCHERRQKAKLKHECFNKQHGANHYVLDSGLQSYSGRIVEGGVAGVKNSICMIWGRLFA